MAYVIPWDGNGGIVSIDGGNFLGRTISIGSRSSSVAVIDDTQLSDTTEQARAGQLENHEPFEVEIYFDANDEPPIGTEGTVRVTHPGGAAIGGGGDRLRHDPLAHSCLELTYVRSPRLP